MNQDLKLQFLRLKTAAFELDRIEKLEFQLKDDPDNDEARYLLENTKSDYNNTMQLIITKHKNIKHESQES